MMGTPNSILPQKAIQSVNISVPYLSLLVGLILLHLFIITSVSLAQIVSVLEAIIILVFLVKKRFSTAVFLFGVFILTSYDIKFFFAHPVGVEEVYNVAFLPIFSVYFYLLLSFVIFAISLYRIIKYRIRFNNPFVRFALFALIVQIPMGLFSMITDGFSVLALTRDIKTNIVPALWGISFYVLFYSSDSYSLRYEKLIIHVLLAYVVVGIITSSLGYFLVRYERSTILYLPLASFFFSSIILFLDRFHRKRDKVLIIVLFAFTVFFQLFFDSCLNGKSWFVFVTVICVELYYIVKKVSFKSILVKVSAVSLIVIAFTALSAKIVSFVNNSENGKLLEFVSLFEGAKTGNLDEVDDSAQFRFLEFITISEYYRDHPQFLLLGKGITGSVPNAGYFVYSETAFSDDQYQNNQFSVMHESLNVIYLKCGLIGLMFFIVVLVNGFKRIKYDALFYIGCVWLFFYWAYSINLLFIGLPAFLIAYHKMEITNRGVKGA